MKKKTVMYAYFKYTEEKKKRNTKQNNMKLNIKNMEGRYI